MRATSVQEGEDGDPALGELPRDVLRAIYAAHAIGSYKSEGVEVTLLPSSDPHAQLPHCVPAIST